MWPIFFDRDKDEWAVGEYKLHEGKEAFYLRAQACWEVLWRNHARDLTGTAGVPFWQESEE